jgi:hypothetical protein
VLGDLDRVEARTRQRLRRIATPATIVGARSGCRPGPRAALERQRGQPVEHRLERARARGRGPRPLGVVGLERRGRSPRTASRCRRRRSPRSTRSRTSSGHGVARSSARRRRQRLELLGVGGSSCRWRSVWRTTPACVETWKPPRRPRRSTSSVEPPPMSITSSASVVAGRARGRAEEGQPRLLVAAERARVEAVALAHARGELAPLAASRTARSAPRRALARAELVDRLAVLVEHANTRSIASSPSAPVASTPSPSRVTIERRSSSSTRRRRLASATSRRVEFVPMSTTATRVTPPGAASARRRARRAGCRRPCRPCARARAHGGRADVRDDEQVRRAQQRVVGRAAARGR